MELNPEFDSVESDILGAEQGQKLPLEGVQGSFTGEEESSPQKSHC